MTIACEALSLDGLELRVVGHVEMITIPWLRLTHWSEKIESYALGEIFRSGVGRYKDMFIGIKLEKITGQNL